MTYALRGQHFIGGDWVDGDRFFKSSPASGPANRFAEGTPALVDAAVIAAENAFWDYGYLGRAARSGFLRAIAKAIDARGDHLTQIATQETGLPVARLEGERGRTVGQLRLFADLVDSGGHLDRRHDRALPDREPMPRPDLRVIQRPIGPVAVFGASNFPLAFSTAGGDTAAALAAGCPVVVKGHPAHPGTCEIVAQAIAEAVQELGLHSGVFSLVQGGSTSVGESLVQHPLVRAVAFTGSLKGGRALFDLCAQRPEPIPFFGELGSINPVFLLPDAVAVRALDIAEGWVSSLTLGAGQFCTNPGVVIVIGGVDADGFIAAAKHHLEQVDPQPMLTDAIAHAYRSAARKLQGAANVSAVVANECDGRTAKSHLFATTGDAWLADESLSEEAFGPLGIVVQVRDFDQMLTVARRLQGQLTCTIHLSERDEKYGRRLMPIIARKAGRLLANGFPTGVEVSDAMVHGGPYPASTNFGATSVGTLSIRRFLRPVCYQDIPESLLPEDLAESSEPGGG